MRVLLYGDLHLGPSDPVRPFERPSIEELQVDLALATGDVIDDSVEHADTATTGRQYEQRGRQFFEYLDAECPVPVVVVPGNHDPNECTDRLVEGVDSVVNAHRTRITAADLGHPAGPLDDVAVVGWGAEQFDLRPISPEFDYDTLGILDVDRGWDDDGRLTRSRVAEVADLVVSTVGEYLIGRRDVAEVCETLAVTSGDRQAVVAALERIERQFVDIVELCAEGDRPTIVLSHVPPFDTAVDKHHSADGFYRRLPTGSIALRLAAMETTPFALLVGHSHMRGQDAIETPAGQTHVFSAGSEGTALLELTVDQDLLVPVPVEFETT